MRKIPFFLGEAYRALRRNAAPSLAAVVTISITVLLLGVLIPVLKASDDKTDQVRDSIALRVFLFKDATSNEVKEVGSLIRNTNHVASVEFVSPKRALSELERDLKREPDELLSSLNQRNPLPPAFNIKLDSPDNLEAVQSALAPPDSTGKPQPVSAAIEDFATADQADTIRDVTGALKILLGVIAVLLGVASIFLVANTIRLSIYTRRREIEVMRLVGATNWFIRWPFVIEGIVVAIMGSAMAVGVLFMGKELVADPLSADFTLVDNLQTIAFGQLVAMLVGAAIFVSALGSGITLRRFLKV